MIKPRRIIFYFLDGVSAMKIKSFNDKKVNDFYNKNIKETVLDELFRKSHVKKYCYGHDDTNQAMYLINSGQSIIESKISISDNPDNLTINRWMIDLLKEKGIINKTHCFANFKREIDDIPWKFDKIEHIKKGISQRPRIF